MVTGAQAYDHWFTQRPSVPREAFCARLGLDPARPILLYLCSSRFFQEDETRFIRRWLGAVRSSPHPQVRGAGVIIRPYPTSRREQWADFDLEPFGNAVVWPDQGEHPLARGLAERHGLERGLHHVFGPGEGVGEQHVFFVRAAAGRAQRVEHGVAWLQRGGKVESACICARQGLEPLAQ